jgi:thiamine-monophosphate kinase
MFNSEAQFVDWLKAVCKVRGPALRVGIGDDAAVVRPSKTSEILLTTDLLIEGVHFLRRLHPARTVGHRALARALSDIAAMGGAPRFALLSLAISRRTSLRWVKDFYAGAQSLASRTGVAIVGGDTALVSGPGFVDAVVTGEVPRGTALLRSGAKPGDKIFVSGRLGISALGLRMLKRGRLYSARRQNTDPMRSHLYPEPRLQLGQFLRANRFASAGMDLSDGLSTDLARLCKASGAGAILQPELIPGPSVRRELRLAEFPRDGTDALRLALNGGEDYELLFTVPRRKAGRVPKRFQGLPLSCIGEIQRSPGVFLKFPDGSVRPLPPRGYEHFRSRKLET